jgi:hypothetical protein
VNLPCREVNSDEADGKCSVWDVGILGVHDVDSVHPTAEGFVDTRIEQEVKRRLMDDISNFIGSDSGRSSLVALLVLGSETLVDAAMPNLLGVGLGRMVDSTSRGLTERRLIPSALTPYFLCRFSATTRDWPTVRERETMVPSVPARSSWPLRWARQSRSSAQFGSWGKPGRKAARSQGRRRGWDRG